VRCSGREQRGGEREEQSDLCWIHLRWGEGNSQGCCNGGGVACVQRMQGCCNGGGDALRRREQAYMRAEAVRRRECMAALGLNGGGEGVELVGLYS
jgi:hypothetical protein